MSRVLPAELRTKKVNSLQGDLKSIAEELLAEKFGIEEEVIREQSRDPFLDGPGDTFGFTQIRSRDGRTVAISSDFYERIRRVNRGYRDEIEISPSFRSNRVEARLRSPDARNMDDLISACRRLDLLNPRKQDRKIFASRHFMSTLQFESSLGWNRHHGPGAPIAEIYGMEVFLERGFDSGFGIVQEI